MIRAAFAASLCALSACSLVATHHDLAKANEVRPRMTEDQVTAILGKPAKTEFSGAVSAWNYCRSGMLSDDYLVVVFRSATVHGMQQKTLTESTGAVYGDCTKGFPAFNFREAVT